MENVIQVKDLIKDHGDFRAVNHISFSAPARPIFGFLGPKGVGKTTTIKMLMTVLSPSAGNITINGLIPRKINDVSAGSSASCFKSPV